MGIETITIVNLRLKTSNTADIYYTTDLGQEGEWYYDAIDTISLDNLGTILVSTNGMRFKRVYDEGFVTATWFFDSSDPDATLGIQRALDFISSSTILNYSKGGGTVFLPKGTYLISKTLLIGQNCRLIGVNNRYHWVYLFNQTSGGTVIKANFSPANKNNWVISSATLNDQDGSSDLLHNNFALSRAGRPNMPNPFPPPPDIPNPSTYNFDNYIYRMGISIENLTINGGDNIAFGGIRLSNAGNCNISNVGVHNIKCAFLLNTCWGGTIEKCFTNFNWYGIIISNCNSFNINDCYTALASNADNSEIPHEELPHFITADLNNPSDPGIDFNAWDLNDTVKYGKTGIFCIHSRSINIIGSISERASIGISILNTSASLTAIYLENNPDYGIVQGIAIDEIQLIVNQLFSYNVGSLFFFGKNAVAKLNAIDCFYRSWLMSWENKLYEVNVTLGRNITFTNVVYHKRKYMPDILFTDECNDGQNFGSVYVDPTNGNDDNYGFNKNDAVKSFDAALVRVQNQSTINPVKIIKINSYIPGDFNSAAFKDYSLKELLNCDLLITSYYENQNAKILFINEDIKKIGQIILNGNSKLCFRNVDLECMENDDDPPSLNRTAFALNKTYSLIIFENLIITLGLGNFFNLITTLNNYSSLEIKFVNVEQINANSLSPSTGTSYKLLVDCIQVNSLDNTGFGWSDSIIIQNNF